MFLFVEILTLDLSRVANPQDFDLMYQGEPSASLVANEGRGLDNLKWCALIRNYTWYLLLPPKYLNGIGRIWEGRMEHWKEE